MADTARRGDTWDLVLRNVIIDQTEITGDTEDAAITYALTHNRSAFDSGSMTWEGHGYEDAWVARFDLPSTAGILVAVATVFATIDSEDVTGTRQVSVKVI